MESIQEARDQHLHVEGIFLDLTKAYNVLNHNTLLGKLNAYVSEEIWICGLNFI